ncbi:NAD(P)/FAD-dependent oxidoreductase [Clostridium psychrophilum]|uniref:NAD(P)/FAD-dependent oxidoreductase n=1 Tax=Clostridium psychrophilum TaxID=132926 RepID=UPI001C0AB6E3|nr:NAD(P)/FAD-dependent oxidoreductase [Clostridium psychrophilum]MBU3181542.1 NAD(P)/FAD-dependent oxidoreductase [Clostridium psychrophilum]
MYDVIIIGKGPAGISASLYTARANLKTLVIAKAEINNCEFLLKERKTQGANIGVDMLEEEVISIKKSDFFEVITVNNKFIAKSLLIATGQTNKKLKVDRLSYFEGKGVSYCTSCDGFFYDGLKVGVLGSKDYAIYEALELKAYTENITIFTNGRELELTDNFKRHEQSFKINYKGIKRLEGNNFLEKIIFNDDKTEAVDGIFIAYESAATVDFANKLGLVTNGEFISVDAFQQTNVKGVFAAGGSTGDFMKINNAVAQGARAGKSVIEYVRNISKK